MHSGFSLPPDTDAFPEGETLNWNPYSFVQVSLQMSDCRNITVKGFAWSSDRSVIPPTLTELLFQELTSFTLSSSIEMSNMHFLASPEPHYYFGQV